MRKTASLCLALMLSLASSNARGDGLGGLLQNLFGGGGGKSFTPAKTRSSASADSGRISWPNLEVMPGRATACQNECLSWKTDFFREPVNLRLDALLLMEEPSPKSVAAPTEKWWLQLRNGDVLLAEDLHPTSTGISLDSPRSPGLSVPASEIRALRRIKSESILYSGPTGLAGWKADGFRVGDGGALLTRRWNENAERRMELPDQVKVGFRLRSTQLPQFSIALSSSIGGGPRIETWKDEVVLVSYQGSKSRFSPILTMRPEDREIRLTLCWDKLAHKAEVYSADGSGLVSIEEALPQNGGKDKPTPGRGGLFIGNQGLNLIIENVQVSRWDGKPLPTVKLDSPRITKADGSSIAGPLKLAMEGISVGEEAVPMSEIDEVTWEDRLPPIVNPHPAHRAIWADGTVVTGKLLAFDDATITLQPNWVSTATIFKRGNLSRIQFGRAIQIPSRDGLALYDKLNFKGWNFRGTLVGESGSKEPLWQVPGATAPSALRDAKKNDLMEVTLAKRAFTSASGALVFLDSGEVMRSRVAAIDEHEVSFTSDLTDLTVLPANRVRAVNWSEPIGQLRGFRDARWQNLPGKDRTSVQLGTDELELNETAGVGHPSVPLDHELRFHVEAKERWGGLKVNLFVDGLRPDDQSSFSLIFWFSGSTLYVSRGDDPNASYERQKLTGSAKSEAHIRIAFVDNRLQVFANGSRMMDAEVDPQKRGGSGITLRAGALWGNEPRACRVSDFIAEAGPGQLPALTSRSSAKQEALTVPRFRRESPPTHVLIAKNGDLVRGRIDAATDKLVKFTAGLETSTVAVNLLEAIVWLQKPDTKPPPAAANQNPCWLTLADGSRLSLNIDEFGPKFITGTSAALGPCKVPLESLAMVRRTATEPSAALSSHLDWQLQYAPEPVLPTSGGAASPLLGKPAPDFTLPVLGGGKFVLAEAKGNVVVLDFWATWCGPCVTSMPGTLKVMEEFADKKLRFVALNQGEQESNVTKFIQQRSWKMTVAMDDVMEVAGQYGVSGIPHTVVIDPTGVVTWVSTGLSADSEARLRDAITKALTKPTP